MLTLLAYTEKSQIYPRIYRGMDGARGKFREGVDKKMQTRKQLLVSTK